MNRDIAGAAMDVMITSSARTKISSISVKPALVLVVVLVLAPSQFEDEDEDEEEMLLLDFTNHVSLVTPHFCQLPTSSSVPSLASGPTDSKS